MDAPAEAVARALAANLLLHPRLVRAVVAYWLSETSPLPVVTGPAAPDVPRDAPGAAARALTALVGRLVTYRPFELALRGTHQLLPGGGGSVGKKLKKTTTTNAEPSVTSAYLVHAWPPMDDWQLAVPDALMGATHSAAGRAVLAALGLMAANPGAYWARVTHGGMRGHVLADTFRFGDALGAVYVPELWVAHVYAALIEAARAHLSTEHWVVYGPGVVRALGATLQEALRAVGGVGTGGPCTPASIDVLTALARHLAECQDAEAAWQAARQLAANLDALAWRLYRRAAAESPLDTPVPVATGPQ